MSHEDITFRWIDGPTASQKDWDRVEDILVSRGQMILARAVTRILMAERGGELEGFIVLQLVPHTEPLFVKPSARGTGLAEELADRMVDYMNEVHARGYMVVADNPSAARLCEARGMTRVEAPVYVCIGEVPK